MKYPNLFSECKVGKKTIKNRIVLTAAGTNLANADGSVSHDIIDYYTTRAKGGAGLITVEVTSVDYPSGKTLDNQLRLDSTKYAKGFQDLADSVHAYGAKVITQLHHAGWMTDLNKSEGYEIVSASDTPPLFVFSQCGPARAITLAEIERLTHKFINAAKLAKHAHLDGIQLHGAHTYLLSQFLSPLFNKRTDEYGGSLENRSRLICNIVKGIRESCGDDFIISVRTSVKDFIPGGLTFEEGIEVCKKLEALGVDMIDVSTGFARADETLETSWKEDGSRVHLAEELKKHISIPVSTVGKIRQAEMCEDIIASGKADFVGMARTLICDPYWPLKVATNREDEIRPCMSCCDGCLGKIEGQHGRIGCSINPYVGFESKYTENDIPFARKQKKIVVIGGGPGGMQAALTAAERGHKVTLLEKESKLGGQLKIASVPPHKQNIDKVATWYENMLIRENVEIIVGINATADYIKGLNPDAVIASTGSVPTIPPISGIENAVQSWDVLNGNYTAPKNKRIVIIGGGIVGCETAEYLATKENEVTVLEMLPTFASGLEHTNYRVLLQKIRINKINIIVNASVKKIDSNGVSYVVNGNKTYKECDLIVVSTGQKPFGKELIEQLKEKDIYVVNIGDSFSVGKIFDAVRSGFHQAYNL